MVYDRTNGTILEGTQRSSCGCETTLTPDNTADEFLLISTNFDGDLILGYKTIQEPDSVTCMNYRDKTAKFCDWIDRMGHHREREDSLHIRISDLRRPTSNANLADY